MAPKTKVSNEMIPKIVLYRIALARFCFLSIKEVSGLGLFEDENVFSASWVQLNGIKYQPGSLLVTGTSLVQEYIPLKLKGL